MGPVTAPSIGIKVPFHYSSRRVYSFPESIRVLGKHMGRVASDCRPDAIAGIEMAGIPIATAISLQYDLPMVIVRKERKEGARFSVEGITKPGMRYVLVDDGFSGGAQKKSAVEFIRETEGEVVDIVVWINTFEIAAFGIDRGRSWIEAQSIRVHYFVSYLSLFEAYYRKGLLSDELFEIIKDFIEHINEWQTDEKKWKWFEEVRVKQHGQFI